MKIKISKAMKKLNDVLPLKERQNNCDIKVRVLHQKILHSFITTGRILSKIEMSKYVDDFEKAFDELDMNELVIFSDSGEPIGAYPFTMENRENKVSANGFKINAMCALDALAISPMFELDVKINSCCRITNDPIYILQSGMSILNVDEVGNVCLCIDWKAVKSDVKCANSLCSEMFFIKSRELANTWSKIDGKNREVFSLREATEFARQYFIPLVS